MIIVETHIFIHLPRVLTGGVKSRGHHGLLVVIRMTSDLRKESEKEKFGRVTRCNPW